MIVADVHKLFVSTDYQILDFKCHCDKCSVSGPEYNRKFCVSFVRHGFFEYRSFRQQSELHAGRILLSKPGYEHITRHIDDQPDITTVFDFEESSYQTWRQAYPQALGGFLTNPDRHSLMLPSTPALEMRHQRILMQLRSGSRQRLQMDEWVYDLLQQVLHLSSVTAQRLQVPDSIIRWHMPKMELARDYIIENYRNNLSVSEIARHCGVSEFHFSRMFRSVFGQSPYQYLRHIRLQQARALLSGSDIPVAQVAFETGFGSAEHLATAYRKVFGETPRRFILQAG